MSTDAIFNLSGMGYLHDIIRKDDDVYAKINVIHRFNAGTQHSDDVWVNCLVKDKDLLSLMHGWKNHLNMQRTIILHFEIQYLGFDYCQHGITEEDPNQIVFLKGKLQCVEKYFINGVHLNEKQSAQQQIIHHLGK